MNTITVNVVRVYILESSGLLKQILSYLRDEAHIRGVSVFRAISGFGESGVSHDASLVDLSLNLPIVVEFFDHPEKITEVLKHIHTVVKPEHIIFWEAQTAIA